jgi:hypothetical protein
MYNTVRRRRISRVYFPIPNVNICNFDTCLYSVYPLKDLHINRAVVGASVDIQQSKYETLNKTHI